MADALNADMRELLTAIREVLDVPQAAAYEHLAARDQLIVDRALAVRGVLAAILEDSHGLSTLQQHADRLRAVVTEVAPVTYPTAQAEKASGGDQ
ncbi:hypothetical protein [Sphaerimonospora mesophila]|uniref:hypothetical protein n=1 Tax=Sphaerimonospora mesophila TaxID=37483 RepID=UPI0006E184FB